MCGRSAFARLVVLRVALSVSGRCPASESDATLVLYQLNRKTLEVVGQGLGVVQSYRLDLTSDMPRFLFVYPRLWFKLVVLVCKGPLALALRSRRGRSGWL